MKLKRRFPLVIALIAAACFLVTWITSRLAERRRAERAALVKPFKFPSVELAALDRDLQARFAVVPTKDFGISRVRGPQHELYVPANETERLTIRKLRQKRTQVAFYLMSRRLWLREWDGAFYKPIQGPVCITEPIQAPLPRAINFSPNNGIKDEIAQQPDNIETNPPRDYHPVPSPTPPPATPNWDDLQKIGNRVFEMDQLMSKDFPVGLEQKVVNGPWRVAAVPIRATQTACLSCHRERYPIFKDAQNLAYQRVGHKLQPELGDALGVAFYLYRPKSEARQKP